MQDFAVFGVGQTDDLWMLPEIYPQDLFARFAVGAHDGVRDERVVVARALKRSAEIDDGVQTFETLLQVLGQFPIDLAASTQIVSRLRAIVRSSRLKRQVSSCGAETASESRPCSAWYAAAGLRRVSLPGWA